MEGGRLDCEHEKPRQPSLIGGLANYLLQRLPRAQLYAVDPFLSGYDPSDRHAHAMAAIASKLGLNKTELSLAWAL